MRRGYYQRFVVLVLSVALSVVSVQASAAAVPAYNGRANQAVGGLIAQKLSRWGFASNDPRISATMGAVGGAATDVALALVAGGAAAVGWPALLVGAGISALVGGAIGLGLDAAIKWAFNTDGSVTASGGAAPTAGQEAYYWASYVGHLVTGTNGESTGKSAIMISECGSPTCTISGLTWVDDGLLNRMLGSGYSGLGQTYNYTYYGHWTNGTGGTWARSVLVVGSPFPYSAISSAQSTPAPAPAGSTPTTKPLADQIAALPQAELAKPASDELIAAAANTVWKKMAANNQTNGVPWSASDPITPADASQWRAANPSQIPTVGDMIAPSVNPATNTVPMTSPTPLYNTGPSPTAGSGQVVNLGENPNTPAPALEATPTAQQILSPVLNLMPDLKSFAVPAHSAGCPTGSFVAFQKTYTFDSHCSLIESNRSIIEAAVLLCWALGAIFIVLRA